MSADNAMLVQKTEGGRYTAQIVFMSADEWPSPYEAGEARTFDTLEELFEATIEEASETEYGYKVHL